MEKRLVGNLLIEQTKGDSTMLLINGDSNLIDKIKVNFADDQTLSLSVASKNNIQPSSTLILRVQTPHPKGVKVHSVGNVSIPGTLNADEFSIHVHGAGEIQADSLYAAVLKVSNDGVGSVILGGNARNAQLKIKGVGHIHAFDLQADSVHAEVNGVGSIRCNPRQDLYGYVNGIGSIKYKTNPKTKTTVVNGLGKIGKE
jgi:hypothetical protein